MDYADRNNPRFPKKSSKADLMNISEDEGAEDPAQEIDMEDPKQRTPIPSEDLSDISDLSGNKSEARGDRRSILKQKLKRVVMKNIKSLKTCLKRRIAAASYPESNEVVIIGFSLLNDLCSSSYDNKAMLFTENGWYHFERIYRKHPLKSLLFLQDVFEADKSLFYVDLTIFERIFNLYRSFCKKIFAKKVRQIQTNNGILIFAWNNLLAEILKINTKNVPLAKVIHLFFKVQQTFDEELITFIFTHIINHEG